MKIVTNCYYSNYNETLLRYLIEFLDNMCGGNVRLALDFVRVFIDSGHVDTEKIISIFHDSGNYLVPLHEFLRAVTYVDHEYYSPQASVILNLFDISTTEGKEHFLSPTLLSQMERWAQKSDSDGYVHVAEIYAYLQTLGYMPSQINWSIGRLLYRNLLETAVKQKAADNKMNHSESDKPSYYRITTVGAYYVKRLVTRFTYLDAIIIDTPLLNSDFRNKIGNEFSI